MTRVHFFVDRIIVVASTLALFRRFLQKRPSKTSAGPQGASRDDTASIELYTSLKTLAGIESIENRGFFQLS